MKNGVRNSVTNVAAQIAFTFRRRQIFFCAYFLIIGKIAGSDLGKPDSKFCDKYAKKKSHSFLNIPRVKFLYVVLQYAISWKHVNGSNRLE